MITSYGVYGAYGVAKRVAVFRRVAFRRAQSTIWPSAKLFVLDILDRSYMARNRDSASASRAGMNAKRSANATCSQTYRVVLLLLAPLAVAKHDIMKFKERLEKTENNITWVTCR